MKQLKDFKQNSEFNSVRISFEYSYSMLFKACYSYEICVCSSPFAHCKCSIKCLMERMDAWEQEKITSMGLNADRFNVGFIEEGLN